MLNGKRVLVTGSSRGIGRAVALQLARDGYTVLVHCAGQTEKAQQTAEEIRAAGGCAAVLRADLCRLEEIDRLAAEMGTVDALVLNASVQYRQKWEQITVEECNRQLTCNFIASMRLIQAAVPAYAGAAVGAHRHHRQRAGGKAAPGYAGIFRLQGGTDQYGAVAGGAAGGGGDHRQ